MRSRTAAQKRYTGWFSALRRYPAAISTVLIADMAIRQRVRSLPNMRATRFSTWNGSLPGYGGHRFGEVTDQHGRCD